MLFRGRMVLVCKPRSYARSLNYGHNLNSQTLILIETEPSPSKEDRPKRYNRIEQTKRGYMVRRKPYSKVQKTNQIRADHVKGMGNTVFVGFQCLNPECTAFITIREDELEDDFCIVCPECGCELYSGGYTTFYEYEVVVNNDVTDSGSFAILHDDYIAEAERYKYCIICNTLKPLYMFDRHSARKSGHQGECRLCKKVYNDIKNGTRTSDQHREAAQKRRLLLDVAGSPRIDGQRIRERYDYRCFNCAKDLSVVTSETDRPLDHTLPVYYLWPLSTENATLLCHDCNGEKSGKWPSEFYDDEHLRKLAIKTGFDYRLLSGAPQYNPDAIEALHNPATVDALLAKYAAYMSEVIKLRNRILKETGFDFFSVSQSISQTYIDEADAQL